MKSLKEFSDYEIVSILESWAEYQKEFLDSIKSEFASRDMSTEQIKSQAEQFHRNYISNQLIRNGSLFLQKISLKSQFLDNNKLTEIIDEEFHKYTSRMKDLNSDLPLP